jgi:putative transposase
MDIEWCTEFIKEAFNKHRKPQILNTDQVVQITSEQFYNTVLNVGVKLVMEWKGRAMDNALIEGLWRSVKY